MKDLITEFSRLIADKSQGHEHLKEADENAIERAESALGVELPAGIKQMYQHVNGQAGASGIIMGFWLLDVDEMIQMTKRLRDEIKAGFYEELEGAPVGPVKSHWMHDQWIPLFGSDNMNISIDLDPDAGGQRGQLVLVDYEDEERVVLAASIEAFMAALNDMIANSELIYDEVSGGFYPEDEDLWIPELFGVVDGGG